MPVVKVPLHLDKRYVRRDFAFCEGRPVPIPLLEPDRAGGFFLRAPAGKALPDPLWVIAGIRAAVPCVTVTLWYNARWVCTIAPDTATYWLPTRVHAAAGLPIRVEQDFGHHGPYIPGTHVLTLVGYFVRDDLLVPPQAPKFADAD